MNFGAPLPNLANAVNGADKLATAREASQKAHEAIENAKEGKTIEALNGNIFVTNAIFANLLKQHQDENARLAEENAALKDKLCGKEEELKASEQEKAALVELPQSRRYVEVLISQTGHATRLYHVTREKKLAVVLGRYAKSQWQDVESLIVVRNSQRLNQDVLVAPDEFVLRPYE